MKPYDDRETTIKRNEIRGYTKYGRSRGGLSFEDSIESVLQAIKQHSSDPQWVHIQRYLELVDDAWVIDCGAGRCWMSYLLAKKGCNVVAVDMNTDSVVGLGAGSKLVRETGESFHLVCADLERLPFRDGVFDRAVGSQFLHHAYSLPAMLKQISSVIKNNGRFIAMNEHTLPAYRITDRTFRRKHPAVDDGVNEHAYHYRFYRKCLENADLEVEESFPYPFWEAYFNRDYLVTGDTPGMPVTVICQLKSFVFSIMKWMHQRKTMRWITQWLIRKFAQTTFSFVARKSREELRNSRE